MDGYGTYAENFAVNWLETNYIVHFAENYIEELTVQDVADFPQTLFGWGLVNAVGRALSSREAIRAACKTPVDDTEVVPPWSTTGRLLRVLEGRAPSRPFRGEFCKRLIMRIAGPQA